MLFIKMNVVLFSHLSW